MTNALKLSSREALVEAAFSLLSRDPGASLADIAAAAGVGRATLHRHFAGREELIRALAMIAIAEMDEAAEAACEDAPTNTEALKRCLEVLIPLGDRHGFLAREPLENDPKIRAEFERQLSETWSMVEAAKLEGAFDKIVPTAWIVQAYDHLLYAAWESVNAGEATHAQAAALAWRTLTAGLKGDAT